MAGKLSCVLVSVVLIETFHDVTAMCVCRLLDDSVNRGGITGLALPVRKLYRLSTRAQR